MAKAKTVYNCTECGHESPAWLGRCPSCQNWNTFVEEKTVTSLPDKPSLRGSWTGEQKTQQLSDVSTEVTHRFPSGLRELDRVLGGGFVPGSMVLVGGDPGIGKSTLLLQTCRKVSAERPVLYVSGEESAAQIRLRANRLGMQKTKITLSTLTDYEVLSEIIEIEKPGLCIIDSIQTLYSRELSSAPGSVSQVREVTAGLLRLAKNTGATIVLVGHVTKDGSLAGPRVLEHMVDTVLYFESETSGIFRMLRAVKNRFGATDEIAFFEMSSEGLTEIENATSVLLNGRPIGVPGSAVTSVIQGTRNILVEIQALTGVAAYSQPQRLAQGMDRSRLALLLAVVEKHYNIGINNLDVFINIVGGMKITETSGDLAIISAIFSCIKNRPIRPNTLILGEIGLTGEVRPVSDIRRRLAEATRYGFSSCVLPGGNKAALTKKRSDPAELPDCIFVDTISEAMDVLFSSGGTAT